MQRRILIHALSLAVTSSAGAGVGLSPIRLRAVASRSVFVHSPRSYDALRRVRSRSRMPAPVGGPLADETALAGRWLGGSRDLASLSLAHHVFLRRSSHTNCSGVQTSSSSTDCVPASCSELFSLAESSVSPELSDSFVPCVWPESLLGDVSSCHTLGLSWSPKGRRHTCVVEEEIAVV